MSKILSLKRSDQRQAGMVAIMVTLILMIVISLIVLGFAQISRRNQREILDRQLSTQAFYAAETAVNDAAELIKTAINSGSPIAEKPDCASNGGGFYILNPVLDASSSVQYTCLTVDATPNALVYSNIGTHSKVVPLIAASGTITSVTLNWQPSGWTAKDASDTPTRDCPSSVSNSMFTTAVGWGCGYGILRFDLVPTAGLLSMANLQRDAITSFVIPLKPGASGATANPISYPTPPTPAGGVNSRLAVICSDQTCSLTINGLGQTQYYLRVSSIYKDVSLQITAKDAAGTTLSLQGAQALIDATGKAQDVLRRIQVRIPLTPSSTNLLSDYAIQSTEAICKRFTVMDGLYDNSADDAVPAVIGSTSNPLCNP